MESIKENARMVLEHIDCDITDEKIREACDLIAYSMSRYVITREDFFKYIYSKHIDELYDDAAEGGIAIKKHENIVSNWKKNMLDHIDMSTKSMIENKKVDEVASLESDGEVFIYVD